MRVRNIMLGAAIAGLAFTQPVLANCGKCDGDKHKGEGAAMSGHHSWSDMTSGMSGEKGSADVESVRFSKLKDANITSRDGKNLGELQDLVLDPQTGEIRYAVLGTGGFLGIAEKRVPVPWSAINVESEKQFSLNVDQEKLRSAPKLDSDFSNLNDPGYAVIIQRFYSVPNEAVGGSDNLEGTTESDMDQSADSSSLKGSSHSYNTDENSHDSEQSD